MKPFFAKVLSSFLASACVGAYDFEWVTTFPGGPSGVSAIVLDESTNTLAAGTFSGTVQFGNNALNSIGQADLFLAKLDAMGGVVWARQLSGASNASALGLARASDGYSYLLASFTDTITVGTNSLTAMSSNDYSDLLVVKTDANGQFIWARTFPLQWPGGQGGITVSAAQEIWVTGRANGKLFLRAYDAAGNVIHHFAPTESDSGGTGIAVGTNGNVYVTGVFNDMLNLGTTNLNGTHPVSDFTAAFNPAGALLWATRHALPGNYSFGSATTVARDDSIVNVGRVDVAYIGAPYPTIFIEKHSPAGELIWARRLGAHRSVFEARTVTTDVMGNVYTGGAKMDPFTFPDPRSGPLLTAWTPAGRQAVSLRVTGSVPSEGGGATSIRVAPDGAVHVGGGVQGTFQFGQFSVVSTNGIGFVARVAAVMRPRLHIAHATNGVTLSWPSAAGGFVLQSSEQFPATNWSNVTAFPTTISNRSAVTLPATASQSVLRLSAP